jgi:putative sigma-54 modulation protein
MSEEEAIDQMQLLGHNFYIFYNDRVGRINVVYRRSDNNYGLLDPELA